MESVHGIQCVGPVSSLWRESVLAVSSGGPDDLQADLCLSVEVGREVLSVRAGVVCRDLEVAIRQAAFVLGFQCGQNVRRRA